MSDAGGQLGQGQLGQGQVAHGLRAQAARRRELLEAGAEPVGWKIGFNLPAVRERLGLDAPVIGFLTSASVVEPGSAVPAGGVGECEVAIHLRAGVPAGAGRAEAGAAIAGLGPAIEVADPPDLDLDIEAILEGNVFHRHVAFGEPVAGAALDGVTARVLVNGEERGSHDALAVTGDPAGVVAHVAALAAVAGEELRAGDRIIAGAMPSLILTAPGDHLELDLGPLGRAGLRFT